MVLKAQSAEREEHSGESIAGSGKRGRAERGAGRAEVRGRGRDSGQRSGKRQWSGVSVQWSERDSGQRSVVSGQKGTVVRGRWSVVRGREGMEP